MNKEITEFYCHECDGYIRVELDYDLNGNHVVECPKCGHEHCRVIKDGKVTSDRWDQRNRNTYNYQTTTASYYTTSMFDSTSSGTSTATTVSSTDSGSSYARYALATSWANMSTGGYVTSTC